MDPVGLSPKISFWFYLASFLCFLVAAAGSEWRFGRLGRQGLAPRVNVLALGLALFVFPTMWAAGEAAF